MNNNIANRFLVLLKREMWESNKLFIASPAVLSVLLLVVSFWILTQIPAELRAEGVSNFGPLLEFTSELGFDALFMILAIPFVGVLYICSIIYLVNSLYHDRKDGSIYFWQSMPVSNIETALSKVVTVCLVAPLITAAASGVLIMFSVIAMSIIGAGSEVESVGFWTLLIVGLDSILMIYLTSVLAALALFPTIGWFLLFSAYARSLPFLWAIGGFFLLLFLEDLIFGTQYLGNWLQNRAVGYNYLVSSLGDFFQKLFNYDLLFGVLLGSLLVTGAVYMRRYSD